MLIVAIVLIASGGDEGPSGAQAAAERYAQALEERDAEAACDQLSAGAIVEIEDRAGRPCVEAFEVLLAALGGEDEQVEGLEVTEVNVAGSVATATIDGPRGEVVSELVLEDGEWKLASPGGR